MEENTRKSNENYNDTYLLNESEVVEYDIEDLLLKTQAIIKLFKKARNIYYDGIHVRLTPSYEPILEQRSEYNYSDPVGQAVEITLDSIDEYNQFNYILNMLYKVMTKEERAYINDCLICDKSETSTLYKMNISRRMWKYVKDSAIVKFALAFKLVD